MAKAITKVPETTEPQYIRETVESIIVAFILAFLFRAFVAEAFVIPTGSMAPTLMGAHKDIVCNECGVRYQVGASSEFDDEGSLTGVAVVGSRGAISQAVNPIDFSDANQATFSGDRILVSKFDYVISAPQRWDVLVFKYPANARMNFIKRLVGLPNEQLLIQEGDVYVRKADSEPWKIARKPPHKALAMRQPVSDTNHTAKRMVALGFPSLWQPWSLSKKESDWTVAQDDSGWRAELKASEETKWLRYYHKVLYEDDWLLLERDNKLPEIQPTESTLVTDFLAYNSGYENLNGPADTTVEELVEQYSPNRSSRQRKGGELGMHWVGDLTGEFDVEVLSDSGELYLQLFEFGIEYRLSINVKTGEAKLQAFDATTPDRTPIDGMFSGQSDVVAATKIRGKGSYHVAIGNVDEQIFVWINDRLVKFNQPAEVDTWPVRAEAQRRPHWTSKDPLDAAPIGIGGQGVALKVTRAQVFRDLYYISTRYNSSHEYNFSNMIAMRTSAARELNLASMNDAELIRFLFANPQLWQDTQLFNHRQRETFMLEEGQYFPLGDNSAASLDARMWSEKYVDEQFLLGKALLVFWPHPWNRPIPFLPNVRRMGLIR